MQDPVRGKTSTRFFWWNLQREFFATNRLTYGEAYGERQVEILCFHHVLYGYHANIPSSIEHRNIRYCNCKT